MSSALLPAFELPLPWEALESWLARTASAYRINRYDLFETVLRVRLEPGLNVTVSPDLKDLILNRTTLTEQNLVDMTVARWQPDLVPEAVPEPFGYWEYISHQSILFQQDYHLPRWWHPTWRPWLDPRQDVKRRGCPVCLTTDATPYIRLYWLLSWMMACPIHGVYLEWFMFHPDYIPEANEAPKDLLWLDDLTLKAVQGQAVSLPSGVTMTPPAWLRLLRALVGEMKRPPRMTQPWNIQCSFFDLLELESGVTYNLDDRRPLRRYEAFGESRQREIMRLVATAVRLLSNDQIRGYGSSASLFKATG